MSSLLVAKLANIDKSFGPKRLLENVSLTLSRGNRVALIGENGGGKSTLAKVLIGTVSPDSGQVTLGKNCELGYLSQETAVDSSKTLCVNDYLAQAQGQLCALQKSLEEIETRLLNPHLRPDTLNHLLEHYGHLQELFESRGGYAGSQRYERVLAGLGLSSQLLDRSLNTLSAGQQRRVALAALLLSSPDLLVLDEPSNHLDAKALLWLQNYLKEYQGALFLISHDRGLLENSCDRILELSPSTHALESYEGNYTAYLKERQKRHTARQDAYARYTEEVTQTERLISSKTSQQRVPSAPKDNNKMAYARHGELAAKGQATLLRRLKKRLKDLKEQAITKPVPLTAGTYHFPSKELVSASIVTLKNATISHERIPCLSDCNLEITQGERVAFCGSNGCGKSTLLRVIAGHHQLTSGEIEHAPALSIGYMAQEWGQHLNTSALNDLEKLYPDQETSTLRKALFQSGLFAPSDAYRPIAQLSSGMRQKVQLAQLSLQAHHLLLLDEPSNHLDLDSLENLEEALLAFTGTLIFVSHDQRMIAKLATRVITIKDCKIREE